LNGYIIPAMKNGINVCKKNPKSKVMSYSSVEDSERSVPGDLLVLSSNVFLMACCRVQRTEHRQGLCRKWQQAYRDALQMGEQCARNCVDKGFSLLGISRP